MGAFDTTKIEWDARVPGKKVTTLFEISQPEVSKSRHKRLAMLKRRRPCTQLIHLRYSDCDASRLLFHLIKRPEQPLGFVFQYIDALQEKDITRELSRAFNVEDEVVLHPA